MPAARKRPNRKRKRRAVSISSSSSDDSSSSGDESSKSTSKMATAEKTQTDEDEDAVSDTNSDSSTSSSSSSDASHALFNHNPKSKLDSDHHKQSAGKGSRPRSPSPGPIAPSALRIPSFLPEKEAQGAKESEHVLQDKFTSFWMNNIVEGFKEDLEMIRKDPALTTSKLSMLIDSLSSGVEVFTPSHMDKTNARDRREFSDIDIVLGT